jgi:hypothetical protein
MLPWVLKELRAHRALQGHKVFKVLLVLVETSVEEVLKVPRVLRGH